MGGCSLARHDFFDRALDSDRLFTPGRRASAVERLFDRAAQLLQGIGLLEKPSCAKLPGLQDVIAFRKTTHDNSFLIWADLDHTGVGFSTVDARVHEHVEQHQVRPVCPDVADGLLP